MDYFGDLLEHRWAIGIDQLRSQTEQMYADIPEKQRQSRGITWVLQRESLLLVIACENMEHVRAVADTLFQKLEIIDRLMGVPIFLMAEYGKTFPYEVLEFFAGTAESEDWVVREFAAAGFHKIITPCRDVALPWLKKLVKSESPNQRRFTSETLRPVTELRWLQNEPQTSLEILRKLFRESHPYPRTSAGNNLSDLARRNPELILEIVAELVENGDKNSYWIAQRACRNMVKKDPKRVMDILGVDEYHYKDRHFYR